MAEIFHLPERDHGLSSRKQEEKGGKTVLTLQERLRGGGGSLN